MVTLTKHYTSSSEADRDRLDALFAERPDKILKHIECLRDGLRHINQRWNDRLVLEDGSFWERYINGRSEIACRFDWRIDLDQYLCFVRIVVAEAEVFESAGSNNKPDIFDCSEGYCWQKIVMLVPVTHAGDGPNMKVRVTARLDFAADKGGKFWEGILYRDVSARGFQVLSFLREGKVGVFPVLTMDKERVVNPVIQGFSQIVDSISHDSRKMIADRLFRFVSNLETIRIAQQNMTSRGTVVGLVELLGEDGGVIDDGFDVLVGPFDL